MTRTITVVRSMNELTGRHAQIAAKINKTMAISELRKACRSIKPKRFRAIVRELIEAKVVKVVSVKA